MKNLTIVLASICLVSCGFNTTRSENTVYSKWQTAYLNGQPTNLGWRIVTDRSTREQNEVWIGTVVATETLSEEDYNKVEIVNSGSNRVLAAGLVTYQQGANFVDLKQPGAFNVTLYPGQKQYLTHFGGTATGKPGQTVYFLLQDLVAN